MRVPKVIELKKIGSKALGYISVAELASEIPFEIKRVYWTYDTPSNVIRGNHGHKDLWQVIIAISGELKILFKDVKQNEFEFKLSNPNEGLIVPPGYWREIKFVDNAILLCLASDYFNESDYIRDYDEFLNHKIKK